jgi:hypothetical protein
MDNRLGFGEAHTHRGCLAEYMEVIALRMSQCGRIKEVVVKVIHIQIIKAHKTRLFLSLSPSIRKDKNSLNPTGKNKPNSSV